MVKFLLELVARCVKEVHRSRLTIDEEYLENNIISPVQNFRNCLQCLSVSFCIQVVLVFPPAADCFLQESLDHG